MSSVLTISCTKPAPVPDGDVAASLTAPTADGHPFDPSTLRGKPSLVVFASPTCDHCLTELPRAQAVAAEANANVVAVFVNGKQDAIEQVIAQAHFTGPVLFDDSTLRTKYGITGVPYTLVIRRDGHAVAALAGEQDDADIREALRGAQ